ncbi:acyltransferase family protein [Mucilaginibacter terrae]|uniref:acyltransferase family protein n=1 Tax=Mucilaginibacter terrae TaxID=1955052 RepID=UPI0036337373
MQQIPIQNHQTRKYYPGITLYKLVGCLLVVFTHIGLPQIYTQLNKSIIGLHSFVAVVVPCFYIISGFLAYQGWSNAKHPHLYVRRYIMWITSVYLIFFIFYLLDNVVPLFVHYGFVPHLILKQSIILLDILFVTGPNAALWFVPPLIFGTISCYYLYTTKKLALASKLALTGFLLTLCMFGTLRILIESIFGPISFLSNTYVNIAMAIIYKYVGFGFTFVFAGTLLGKYDNKFLQLNAWTLTLLTSVVVMLEIILLNYIAVGYHSYYFVFSMMPLSILAFYGILHVKLNGVLTYHKFINAFTILTFFCHVYFIDINMRILGYKLHHTTIRQTALCLLLTLMEGLIFTSLVLYAQRSFKIPIKKLLSFN